jgi:hypothetical protein
MMRGGEEAKTPDNVTDPTQQPTNGEAWREGEAPAERQREATGKHDNQLNKWSAIAWQKLEAPAEGVIKADRAADKRRRRDESGATITTMIR